jgi:N6-adenosine-specific RNA methylase IME4
MKDLPQQHYGAILADPPWLFATRTIGGRDRSPDKHYRQMPYDEIMQLPVGKIAKTDCVLFLWITWPLLQQATWVIEAWGFTYKTCAFAWMKADVSTLDMFDAPKDVDMKLGYWTRSNSEVCLLATRGKPKRNNRSVRQGIIEPAREHSRKPDCVYDRIERLVDGPYLELFARQRRPGWEQWGNQLDKFREVRHERRSDGVGVQTANR